MWATYIEWKEHGRAVERGSKSRLEDPSGNKLFHHSQTVEKPKQVLADEEYSLPSRFLQD